MYKDLVKQVYDKIFFENLHIISKEIESIKGMILKTQGLISDKAERSLFVSELANKIKIEKIDVAKRQQIEFGSIIMANYEDISSIYMWLETVEFEQEFQSERKRIWNITNDALFELANSLATEKLIDEVDVFYNIIVKDEGDKKINWLGTNKLLIYLICQFKENGFINQSYADKSLIEKYFLSDFKQIKNVKQVKNNMLNQRPPKYHEIIDLFIDRYKNALPW